MKERKLDKVYKEFDQNYQGKTKEEMDKIISDLEKEVTGKENALVGKEGKEKENLSKDIESKKKRLNNLKGYTKNKNQIEGIKNYKTSLEGKLVNVQKNKENIKKQLAAKEKKLLDIEKKLADENYTMSLDQNKYNKLYNDRVKYTDEVKKIRQEYKTLSNRVEELKMKISKCDLAWRSLFVNKDWDEIHKIAITDTKRFTRNVNEKNEPISQKDIDPKDEVGKMAETIHENIMGKIKGNNEVEQDPTKALVPIKESFFRRTWNKIKQFFKEARQEGKGNVVETQNINREEPEVKAVKQDRDKFIDGLRQHVDVEYKKEIREAKEAELHKKHEPKFKDDNNEPTL